MMNYRLLSDLELTERLNRRDKDAFKEIYQRYWALLFQHARKMLRDDRQAEDLVQDVFMMILGKEGMLKLNSTLSAYLYSITRNRVINLIRRDKVKSDYLRYLEQQSGTADTIADRDLLEKELALKIEKEIEALPPKMREVFEMSRKAYLSTSEIARQRNVSENTVKKQLYHAIRILKGRLSSYLLLQFMLLILWVNR